MLRFIYPRSDIYIHAQIYISTSDLYIRAQIYISVLRYIYIHAQIYISTSRFIISTLRFIYPCSDLYIHSQIYISMLRFINPCSDLLRFIYPCSDLYIHAQIYISMPRFIFLCPATNQARAGGLPPSSKHARAGELPPLIQTRIVTNQARAGELPALIQTQGTGLVHVTGQHPSAVLLCMPARVVPTKSQYTIEFMDMLRHCLIYTSPNYPNRLGAWSNPTTIVQPTSPQISSQGLHVPHLSCRVAG